MPVGTSVGATGVGIGVDGDAVGTCVEIAGNVGILVGILIPAKVGASVITLSPPACRAD